MSPVRLPLMMVVSCATAVAQGGFAQADPFQDTLVQPPGLVPPQRGSVAGTLSRTAFGPSDLARGAFQLRLPIEAPEARGPLLAGVIPAYSPESGISEWGHGWQVDLSIRRFRSIGELDFASDEFSSPWGRLALGTDAYYPAGLQRVVRVVRQSAGWSATTSDGTRFTFSSADAVVTSQGVYEWKLSRIENIFGDSTTLEWSRNATGRAFLAAIYWGGRNDGTQYAMRFDYESLPVPFVSFVSGEKQLLDRRIKQVAVLVKQNGSLSPRWTYALTYQSSPSGPAFYLQSITKHYASGHSDPPVTYGYDLGTELQASAQFTEIGGLGTLVASHGGGLVLEPSQSTMSDLEQNGLTDVEFGYDQTTLRQTGSGFVAEVLPAASDSDERCRPAPSWFNRPRALVRMHGEVAEPQVAVIENNWDGVTTRLLVCDRLGVPIFDQLVPGTWGLDANTRLADIDQDRRPDIVRVGYGAVEVLRNTSSSPTTLAFEPGPTSTLSPAFSPLATWIFDVNGDGRADLLSRHESGVVVWLGKGGGKFTEEGIDYAFTTATGPLANLSSYQFSHGDFNADGLVDLILSSGTSAILFTNQGDSFVETPIASLANIPWAFSYPLVADLSGSGNEEVVFVTDSHVMSLPLTSASTGLMRRADDGKGTVLEFGYDRVHAAPGIQRRYAVLSDLTMSSSGYDTVSYHYSYGQPILQSKAKYLIGYETVDKQSPALTERIEFWNDDDIAGVKLRSEDTDSRTPGVVRFSRSQYVDAQFHGVRWLRPSSMEAGFRDLTDTSKVSEITQYSNYERELCPTVTTTSSSVGQLVTATTLANVVAIPDELSCVPSVRTLIGLHNNAALDFNYRVRIARNDQGQVTRITQFDSLMHALVLQDVEYDFAHRLQSASAPGRGATTLVYDETGRLASVTDPIGVETEVDEFDPITDAIKSLTTLRPEASLVTEFRYDGRERLHKSWDDVSGASELLPLATYDYQDPTTTTPGRIQSRSLIDASSDSMRTSLALVGADGQPLLSGEWLGDHLAAELTSISFRNTLTKRSSVVGSLSAAQLNSISSAALRTLGTPIVEDIAAGFGHSMQTTTTQQSGVVGTVTSEVVLASTGLITRTHQPGGFTSESEVDAAGHLRRRTDENGVSHWYSYDALGRLVAVDTPDGLQSLVFDGFARPQQVTRAGLGAIRYAYDPVTGLLASTQHLDANGVVVDSVATSYDAVGRPTTLTQSTSTESSNLVLEYDGQIDATVVDGQLGRQSHVRGEGWDRTTLFDALGRAYQQRVRLDGWRDVTTDTMYRSDGAVMFDTVTIADASGNTQLSVMHETIPDEYGRPGTVWVDGLLLYTLSYDAESRLARADFTSGESITFDYDPVTHARTGYTVTAPNATGGVHWNRDPRGLVADELYANGTTSSRRDYAYDGRGALTSSAAGAELASYSYTASGLPNTITDLAGTRMVHRTSSQLTVGDTSYTWDAAGRVVAKGEWTMTYGPDGQLRHASRPGREVDYVYDDGHARLLKRVDGVPVRANVAGGVLTEDHFIELVTVGGVVAGILDNGEFTALLTDPRGTPFAAADGTPNMATPYGVRASHLGFSEAIDYTRLGWDPDLDVVRMGVRDYDSNLSQFWTPDPLYFADLEKCQTSPLQCAFYGYAAGNPISFIDPRGTDVDGLMHGTAPDYGAVSLEIAHAATNAVYETICAFVGCGTAGGGGDTWQRDSNGSRLEVNGHPVADYSHATYRVSYKEQAVRVATIVGLGKLANIVVPKAVRTLIGDEASALLNSGEGRLPATGVRQLSERELGQVTGGGGRPEFRPNPAHRPGGAGFRPNKTIEPPDSASVFESAIEGERGVFYGSGEGGAIYRFSPDNAGGVHFSGSTVGPGGIRLENIPISVRRALGRTR